MAWSFTKKKEVAVENFEKQAEETVAKLPEIKLESIKRSVPQRRDDTFRETLNKAKQLLDYKPRDIVLGNVLADLEIETLDGNQVRIFMESKNQGHGLNRMNFIPYKFSEYKHPIPVHVLNKAIQIKEKLPEVEFVIYHYELGDPFLFVMHNGYGWYIEAWDEPTFEGRATK